LSQVHQFLAVFGQSCSATRRCPASETCTAINTCECAENYARTLTQDCQGKYLNQSMSKKFKICFALHSLDSWWKLGHFTLFSQH